MKTLTQTEIDIINGYKTAKITDSYIGPKGLIWVGTPFGTLVIPPYANQIFNPNTNASIQADITALQVENANLQAQINAIVSPIGDVNIVSGNTVFSAHGIAKIRTISNLGVL